MTLMRRIRSPLCRTVTVLAVSICALGLGTVPALAAAPTITTFTPTSGTVGTLVKINGTSFAGATSVAFNGKADVTFTVATPKKIFAHVPAGATSGPISVTTPDGTATSGTTFTVIPSPTVTLDPARGGPGSTVEVSGVGFGAFEIVDIYFDTTDQALGATNDSGAFPPVAVGVPASALPGTHWISVQGRRSGLGAQAMFTVQTDWPQFHFSNRRVGANPTENVLSPSNVSGLDLDWSHATASSIYSSPAVARGIVYVGSQAGTVYALNASTGAMMWSYPTGSSVYSSPAVANGVVYVGSEDGNVHALNASTGAFLWSHATGAMTLSSPAVANGVVYVESSDGNLYALNASSGAVMWSSPTAGSGLSSPAVANGVVYVGSQDGSVYALSASTGTYLWSFSTGDSVYASPAVVSGVVYAGSHGGTVYALNASNGAFKWSQPAGYNVYSSPAVANGIVYVGRATATSMR